jgi:hypothetical protein
MKLALQIAALIMLTATSHAWRDLTPDYGKQFEAADLVAVVRVSSISETGITNQLRNGSRLLFREIAVRFDVVSLMKGGTNQQIMCKLYRFPTTEEATEDLGTNGKMELLAAGPWESGLFIPRKWYHYLAYLKRTQDGNYVPVSGFEMADHCLVELTVPHN